MAKNQQSEALHKLAHDLRGAMHSAQLNLEAAQTLAAKVQDQQAERLRKHLSIVTAELHRLKQMVEDAAQQLA